MTKVIATDLDGTLLYPMCKIKLVDERFVKIIQRFPGEIVFATGRGHKFSKKINKILKVKENYICFNGALIIRNAKIIGRQTLKKVYINNLYSFVMENYSGVSFYLFDENDRIILSGNKSSWDYYISYIKRRLKNLRLSEKFIISQTIADKVLNDDTDLYKAMIYVDNNKEEILSELKFKYSKYFDFCLNSRSIEISPKGVNKGEALRFLLANMKIEAKDVYTVGNDNSDLPLITDFEKSFTLSNGDTQLKSKAKYIINDFSEIEEYLD